MEQRQSRKSCSFFEEYERMTLLQNAFPLPYIMAHREENALPLNADRIRENEWKPILAALRKDSTLKYITISSTWQRLATNGTEKAISQKKKLPIRTRSLTSQLSRTLKDVLISNPCLECLVLQNIPFREEDLHIMSKGLAKVTALKFLSLEQCPVRDKSFVHLMEGIRKATSVVSINFTKCGLTWKSMPLLATIIKHQSSQRHDEAWQASLRYRKPDFDQMYGLRRVTLCQNKLGDEGARILADALKDDIWLKALDLQQCGLSDDSALILMETLQFNKSLVVLDVRRNSFIGYQNLRSLIEKVMVNAGGESSEYPWLKASSPDENKADLTFNKKSSTSLSAKKSKRNLRRKSLEGKRSRDQVPWRMAERVRSRYSNTDVAHSTVPYFTQQTSAAGNCKVRDTEHPLFGWSEKRKAKAKRRKRVEKDLKEVLVEENVEVDFESESENEDISPKTKPHLSASHEKRLADDYLQAIDQLREELEDFRGQLNEERNIRREAEKRIEKLEHENQVLKHTVEFYKHQSKVMEDEKQSTKKTSLNFKMPDFSPQDLLENENALTSIESSFQQFQQFLDMLKNLGLDDVCQQFDQQPATRNNQKNEKS